MAKVNALVRRPRAQVWQVLADGSAYAEWVVGTQEIRAVDDGWPAVGTAIHYTIGVGPVQFRGSTVVRQVDEGRLLGLEADADPFGSARIVIELSDWGEDTIVEIDEHPLRGPGWHLHNAVTEALLMARGRPMVGNLARLVERRNPA